MKQSVTLINSRTAPTRGLYYRESSRRRNSYSLERGFYTENFPWGEYTGKELDEETGLYYFGARYQDPRTARWLSADPALSDYIPGAPINDDVRKANQNLPGMGGVFNTVNLHLYHYAGNNPVKYVDPDGRFQMESPHQKNKSDPNNERGYRVSASNYNEIAQVYGQQLPAILPADLLSKSNKSRSEGGIPNDRGRFSLDGFHFNSTFLLSWNPEELGPIADSKTMEIYTNLFGGTTDENGDLIAPKDQSYGQVRNRIGAIFGLVAYAIGQGKDHGFNSAALIEGVNIGSEFNNLPQNEQNMIVDEINRMLSSEEL